MTANQDRVVTPEHQAEPVDLSRFADILSSDHSNESLMESVIYQANAILEQDGKISTIDNVEALVSDTFAETSIANTTYFARVFRYTEKGKAQAKMAIGPDMGLVLDTTNRLPVSSPNPRLFMYLDSVQGKSLMLGGNSLETMRLGNNQDIMHLKGIQDKLGAKVQQKIQEAEQRKATEEEQEKTRRKFRRSQIARTIGRGTTKTLTGILIIGAVSGAAYGGYKAISAIDIYEFDEDSEAEVPNNPAILTVGTHDVTPSFSSDLINIEELAKKIPHEGEENYVNYSEKLRRLTMLSSKEGKNCATVNIEDPTLNDVVLAWTDFVDENGYSRADELSVSHMFGEIEACFVGQETDDDDDPEVVIKVINSSELIDGVYIPNS